MELVYTLLTSDLQAFDHQYRQILPWSIPVQIDVQDGVYVPNTTLTTHQMLEWMRGLGTDVVSRSPAVDFHLQVSEYESCFDDIRKFARIMPVRYVFVHTNCERVPHDLIVCPAYGPQDDLTHDKGFAGAPIDSYPAVQIMTIHPGRQGQDFIPSQLLKIKALRESGYAGRIYIDGGVNPKSLTTYILGLPNDQRPDACCVGSYLTQVSDEDIALRIQHLRELLDPDALSG